MSAVVETPRELLEAVADLRLPQDADYQLQRLMDRSTEGTLTPEEAKELAALAELSEKISLLRADAMSVLGRNPL